MAAGCAEAAFTEAGVRTPRFVLAFQRWKGVKWEQPKLETTDREESPGVGTLCR